MTQGINRSSHARRVDLTSAVAKSPLVDRSNFDFPACKSWNIMPPDDRENIGIGLANSNDRARDKQEDRRSRLSRVAQMLHVQLDASENLYTI